MLKRLIDLTNQKFGRLTVVERGPNKVGKNGDVKARWVCKCDCGNEQLTLVYASELRKGVRKSCGCLHREQNGTNHVLWKGYGEIPLTKWNHIKSHAVMEERNIKFAISIEFAWELFLKQGRKCALTGLELDFGRTSVGKSGNASLDRIDSTKDYTKDNVQWVHKLVNKMKQDLPQEEFIQWCHTIANYQKEKHVNN